MCNSQIAANIAQDINSLLIKHDGQSTRRSNMQTVMRRTVFRRGELGFAGIKICAFRGWWAKHN